MNGRPPPWPSPVGWAVDFAADAVTPTPGPSASARRNRRPVVAFTTPLRTNVFQQEFVGLRRGIGDLERADDRRGEDQEEIRALLGR